MDNFKYETDCSNIITPPDSVNNELLNVLCVNLSQTDIILLSDLCKTATRSYNFYLWHDGLDEQWYDRMITKADAIISFTEVIDHRVINIVNDEINTDIKTVFEILECKEF